MELPLIFIIFVLVIWLLVKIADCRKDGDMIRRLNTENEKLKKELDFFKEIDADAKRLNASSQDLQAEEALLATVVENPTANVAALDDEQRQAYDRMVHTNQNLFITGKAGTGKSFLLKLFARADHGKQVILLAPTGIAAMHIGGSTLHSAFGYTNLATRKLEEFDDVYCGDPHLPANQQMVLKHVDTLVIDEISMVRADVFEKIDRILRMVMRRDIPFGGKQIIAFGDVFQLPPIADRAEYQYLSSQFGGIHFFCADAYKNGNFAFIELTVNHRQKEDLPFFELLNRLRMGDISPKDLAVLNTRADCEPEQLRRVVHLFPKKADVERVNAVELHRIPAREYVYTARVLYAKPNGSKPLPESAFPIKSVLQLKRGALVMMVANDREKRWVNGTLGIVAELDDTHITVSINGKRYEVGRYTFEENEAVLENGKITYKSTYQVQQFPLVLAYAMTIHKSQGMTYQQVACDLSACFSPGQAYVALSRCSCLQGLYLLHAVDRNMLRVDTQARDFYLQQTAQKEI